MDVVRPSTPPPSGIPSISLHKVNSSPARGFETVMTSMISSKSQGDEHYSDHRSHRQHQKPPANSVLDRFGFITNMDANGKVDIQEETEEHIMTFQETKQQESRSQKWEAMLPRLFSPRMKRTIKRRLRKGIPFDQRAKVWCELARVPDYLRDNRGVYAKLVRKVVSPRRSEVSDDPKTFRSIQETIERDIHRTFPRHSMFYERDHDEDTSDAYNEGKTADQALCGTADISGMIRELELAHSKSSVMSRGEELPPEHVLQDRGGQASLRRVLKAYSSYDVEIGYCQGMNFIAAMFLTLVSEEEAFWLLVAVMNDKPCRMRGLFGEGMKETHQILHVADRLIHQFLPKLASHFDKEQMHITMFCTQWLLTVFTSSFPFELVTRAWDCFLFEGWKVVYRVMLALLQRFQGDLLQLGFEEILAYLRELPGRVRGQNILEAALRIPLRRSHILKYEREWERESQ